MAKYSILVDVNFYEDEFEVKILMKLRDEQGSLMQTNKQFYYDKDIYKASRYVSNLVKDTETSSLIIDSRAYGAVLIEKVKEELDKSGYDYNHLTGEVKEKIVRMKDFYKMKEALDKLNLAIQLLNDIQEHNDYTSQQYEEALACQIELEKAKLFIMNSSKSLCFMN